MKKVKITVLKTTLDQDLAREYGAPAWAPAPCSRRGRCLWGLCQA